MFSRRIYRIWSIIPRARPNTPSIRFPLRRAKSTKASSSSRIDKISARLPRRLRRYTDGLRNAPMSHVVSFLILHELTAMVPLVALFGVFHYTDKVPTAYMTNHFGGYVDSGIARFERYFSRKGWFGFSRSELEVAPGSTLDDKTAHAKDVMQRSQQGDQKYKFLVDVALAYAFTKVLLPVRIVGSVWATPWFARMLLKGRQMMTRKS